MELEELNKISASEIIETLKDINSKYFKIENLNEYAQKVTNFGSSLVVKNKLNTPISYVLFYDNGPEIFITMVWTAENERGKGYAKNLISKIISESSKDILLEVHEKNPALYLYMKLGFEFEKKSNDKISMRYKQHRFHSIH